MSAPVTSYKVFKIEYDSLTGRLYPVYTLLYSRDTVSRGLDWS